MARCVLAVSVAAWSTPVIPFRNALSHSAMGRKTVYPFVSADCTVHIKADSCSLAPYLLRTKLWGSHTLLLYFEFKCVNVRFAVNNRNPNNVL